MNIAIALVFGIVCFALFCDTVRCEVDQSVELRNENDQNKLTDLDQEENHVRNRRGFGCPFNRYECHNHCRSIGRKGGYCAGALRTTCTCYKR